MKMKPEDYTRLQSLLRPRLSREEQARYLAAGQSSTRYLWDMLWEAGREGSELTRDLYRYLNDSHIETALRKIASNI